MLGVSAQAFGGLQVVLQGTPLPPRQPPESVGTGLRQAADAVAAGFGAWAPGCAPAAEPFNLDGALAVPMLHACSSEQCSEGSQALSYALMGPDSGRAGGARQAAGSLCKLL